MKNVSAFQIGILIFSIVVIAFAVLIFSGIIPIGKGSSDGGKLSGNFVIWGTAKADGLRDFFDSLSVSNTGLKINYLAKDPRTFSLELAEAIASGVGPDLILMSQEDILQNQAKLVHIPYSSLPEQTFRNTYIEEGSLFMLPDGIVGLPVAVDPIVMYYNKNLLENAGYSVPPKTWDVLTGITPSLTKKQGDLTINQSAVPFGVYSNLNNAKDILSMLFIQVGEPIVAKQNEGFSATLGFDNGTDVSPAQAVLQFFTQFSDPVSKAYTWNKAQVPARDAFIRESLVFYFGYASELPAISEKNPNLNFDIIKVPQLPQGKLNLTFGKVYALGVIKAGKNPQQALSLATLISSPENSQTLVSTLSEAAPLAPARRDLIGTPPETPAYATTIYASGLMARGWYDPGDYFSDPIMSGLIDDIVRGAATPSEALSKARSQLQLAL